MIVEYFSIFLVNTSQEEDDWEKKDFSNIKPAESKWRDEDTAVEEPKNDAPKSAPRNPEKKKPVGKIAEEKEKQTKPTSVIFCSKFLNCLENILYFETITI